MYSSDLDTKYSTLVDQLQALNAKFSAFMNGTADQTVPTDNGPLRTLAGVIANITKTQYIQKMIDHRLYSDMINDSVNISTGMLVRVWGDSVEVNGIYQKKDDGSFSKINYQLLGGDQSSGSSGGKLLYGSVAPDVSIGNDGDFYIDITSIKLYGPKLSTWPEGISLVGPKGDTTSTDGSLASNLLQKTAAVTLSGHRLVVLDQNNMATYASSNTLTTSQRVIGITTTSALVGEEVTIQTSGEVVEPTWNWDVSKMIYLGIGGYLTQTPPTSGFLLIVGVPSTPTSMIVNIRQPIILS